MTKQLFVGLYTEGNTDKRYLENVVKRTFDEIAFEASGDFEIYIQPITLERSGLSFVEQIVQVAKSGLEKYGITILCVHKDADDINDETVYKYSINPALFELSTKKESEVCKVTATIVPVQMLEAWLLADKEIFKTEIGTNKTDRELGIHRFPEAIADPKETIKEAIRIARKDVPQRKRRDLTINEIYMPLGQKITIEKLNLLPSFLKFKESVRSAFRSLNYLH